MSPFAAFFTLGKCYIYVIHLLSSRVHNATTNVDCGWDMAALDKPHSAHDDDDKMKSSPIAISRVLVNFVLWRKKIHNTLRDTSILFSSINSNPNKPC